ncbi:hypothetical protein [Pseudoclavibacter helvolus]|uniref:hypothetical protein n=1 Tax=Pseudoclavibacter helvolus TaxID=255205 RepID=UPI003C77965A
MLSDALFVFLAYALSVVLAGSGGVFYAVGSVPANSWPVKGFALVSIIVAGLLVCTAFPSLTWIGVIYALVAVASGAVSCALRWKTLPVFHDQPLSELLRIELLRPSILRRLAAEPGARPRSDDAERPRDAHNR